MQQEWKTMWSSWKLPCLVWTSGEQVYWCITSTVRQYGYFFCGYYYLQIQVICCVFTLQLAKDVTTGGPGPGQEQTHLGTGLTIKDWFIIFCTKNFHLSCIITLASVCYLLICSLFCTGEKNLIEIADYLFELDKTHIYHLGLLLGLSHHRVKAMEDSKTFLDDMIAAWLQKVDQVGVPTWQRLVKALRHRRVGQTGIASEIEKGTLLTTTHK